MKKLINTLFIFALLSLSFSACTNDDSAAADESGIVSAEVLSQIKHLGFSAENVIKEEGGYIVEGDIFLKEEDLHRNDMHENFLRVAETEQYRTTNIVTGLPRTITVSVSGTVNAAFSSAVDAAIARYNAENLGLTFQRVTSGGDINIRIVNTRQYIASAGFPDASGNPFNEIKYAKTYTSGYSAGFMTTVLAHEIGHCIGFRHTDYADRSYSCGGAASNEGASTVGAILIPGTPNGPDPNSWMLACLGATTNRPFNANDKTALNFLY